MAFCAGLVLAALALLMLDVTRGGLTVPQRSHYWAWYSQDRWSSPSYSGATRSGERPDIDSHHAPARFADARAWAGWIRALRAEIADRRDAGDLNPDLAAPEPVHQTLLELLARIDALPREVEHADLALPPPQQMAAFVHQLQLVHSLVDHWVEVGLLAARPPPEVQRFEQQLIRCAQPPDDRG